MLLNIPIKGTISIALLCVLISLQFLGTESGWMYKNEVEAPICFNPNNHLGFCVPIKECAAFDYVLKHNLNANFKFFLASQCERGTGDAPFVCCTNDIEFREKKKEEHRNYRIIFPDELEKVKNAAVYNSGKTARTQNEDLTKTSTEHTVSDGFESMEFSSSEESITTLSPSTIKSTDNFPKPPKCGSIVISNKIYGGQDADFSEFSWMVILEYRNLSTGQLLMDCAGSLINNRYVLTAAHCVQGDILRNIGRLESVRVGAHNTESDDDCNETGCLQRFQRVPIESVIPHPDFRFNSYDGFRNQHDIALLRLKQQVNFNDFLQPVCLPNVVPLEELKESTKLVVAGWGHNGTMVRTAIKQKLELPLVKHEACREIYKKKFYLADEQICAGGRFREDSCNGDSGGPLMRIKKDFWTIEGIVSFGLKCGLEQPGIYTNVRHYLEWINKNVKTD